MSNWNEALRDAVLRGDNSGAEEVAQKALDAGVDPLELINYGLVEGMNETGRRFEAKEYYVPDLLIAARAMKAALNLILPEVKVERATAGTVVMGTVEGDIHDIGKSIVCTLLETGGFKVIDLGVNVPVAKFVEAVKEHQPQIVGISALLTFTMPGMKLVIEAFEAAGVRESVKVIVGGAPVSDEFARKIGADAYAPDAVKAVERVRQLVSQ